MNTCKSLFLDITIRGKDYLLSFNLHLYIRCSIYQPIAKITTAPQYNLSIFITRTCNQNKTTLIKNVFLYTLYASAYSLGVFP